VLGTPAVKILTVTSRNHLSNCAQANDQLDTRCPHTTSPVNQPQLAFNAKSTILQQLLIFHHRESTSYEAELTSAHSN